ncbi:hypothetical protein V2P11_09220 [Parageobacillus toebii]|uniref:hypothetical protein n=1 Tax=Parageobacillus toebii TaxID=153151 RepID=UPI0035C72745
MKNIEEVKPSIGDIIHTAVKAGISSIPMIGSFASEFYSMVITPPLEKRKNEWLNSLAEKVNELEQKQEILVDNLSKNDLFITAVLQATQIALRNHQKEKLRALRNVVLNTAINTSIEDNKVMMFLQFVDILTVWHLKILMFLNNPRKWLVDNKKEFPNLSIGSPAHILEAAFPELKNNRNFYDKIIRDLYLNGLINIESLHITMSSDGMYASRTTEFGKEFIEFIQSPLKDNE